MAIPPWQFQRASTPPLIKRLLQITCWMTFIAVALDSLLGLQSYIALSPLAYERYFLWQPITALFILPGVISFSYLLDFAFVMLLIWLFGSILLERIGAKRFLFVYLASGVLSGIAGLYIMHEIQAFGLVSELLPIVLAITTLWTMADPYQEILLFFILPMKARWVLVFALLGTIFSSFMQHDLAATAAYLTAFIFSYFYGLMILRFRSPFDWMLGIDRFFQKIANGLERFFQWYVMGSVRKALDYPRRFKQKQKRQEDAFVDTTLDKISKNGTSSLNLYERLRLKWISLKRRK
jgi:membrane associated rhomboid family serine protease